MENLSIPITVIQYCFPTRVKENPKILQNTVKRSDTHTHLQFTYTSKIQAPFNDG
jgi:hypothetical protein